MDTLKEKTAKGLFWGGLSNVLQQMLNLVFGIFLARLLSTEDYGLVGMLTIFSLVANSLQEGGYISALNRRKEASHKDYNAVFWTCTLTSLLLYVIFALCTPLIARFYHEPRLVPLARYIFLGFFISSLGIAPRAILFRNMKVRETAIVNFVGLLLSGIVGVCMAAADFAYWGIATQSLVYVGVTTGLNFWYARWHPTLPVDFSPVREMIGFSSKLIVTSLVVIFNTNMFSVILGRKFPASVVGNYTQANKWNNMGWLLINNMLSGIAQPVLAKTDDEPERQKRIFRKLLRFTAFVSFPAMLGLALVSHEFIVILLGEKWLDSALILQWLCVMGAFYPLSNLFSYYMVSHGQSSRFMWCHTALGAVQLAAVFVSAPYGMGMMIKVYVGIAVGWFWVWYRLSRNWIGLTLYEVVKDISPYFFITVALVFSAQVITEPIASIYIRFAAKVLFVASLYVLVLWLLGSAIFRESLDFFESKVKFPFKKHAQ